MAIVEEESDASAANEGAGIVGHQLSRGWLFDLLTQLPDPAFAIGGGVSLFRIELEATEVNIKLSGTVPMFGFTSIWFVSGRSEQDAAETAKRKLTEYWRDCFRNEPSLKQIEVIDSYAIAGYFRWRSRMGLIFFPKDAE